MTILLHKPYFAIVTTKGEGCQNTKKINTLFMDDPKQKVDLLKSDHAHSCVVLTAFGVDALMMKTQL